jgi:hypothetical protein
MVMGWKKRRESAAMVHQMWGVTQRFEHNCAKKTAISILPLFSARAVFFRLCPCLQ